MHWEHVIMMGTRCECWGTRASWIRVFDVHVVMEFEKILGRLKKMTVANHSRQHQRTSDTFFVPNL
jgi:homoserine trans-succinylase